jgi:ribosome recycling factor
MTSEIINSTKAKMDAVLEHTKEEFSGIRTGRANAALFSGVTVNYYGAPTPIQLLASFNIPENRLVVITPFDKGAIDAVVKGLQESNLGVNPARDGDHIRVVLPELTTERRQEYVKLAKVRSEESKVSLRSVRHKAIDAVEKLLKDKEIGEDDAKRTKEDIDKLTKKLTDEIDVLLSHKEAEILEV